MFKKNANIFIDSVLKLQDSARHNDHFPGQQVEELNISVNRQLFKFSSAKVSTRLPCNFQVNHLCC